MYKNRMIPLVNGLNAGNISDPNVAAQLFARRDKALTLGTTCKVLPPGDEATNE
jgi:hypothetical protein